MKILSILLPVFNLGQAFLVIILGFMLTIIAIFIDALGALYIGAAMYVAVVLYMFLRKLAPDEAEIREDEIGPISALLATAPFVYPIQKWVWAPARSRSWLFKSDWITINSNEEGNFILKARKRDLQIILDEIREKKADGQ